MQGFLLPIGASNFLARKSRVRCISSSSHIHTHAVSRFPFLPRPFTPGAEINGARNRKKSYGKQGGVRRGGLLQKRLVKAGEGGVGRGRPIHTNLERRGGEERRRGHSDKGSE